MRLRRRPANVLAGGDGDDLQGGAGADTLTAKAVSTLPTTGTRRLRQR